MSDLDVNGKKGREGEGRGGERLSRSKMVNAEWVFSSGMFVPWGRCIYVSLARHWSATITWSLSTTTTEKSRE